MDMTKVWCAQHGWVYLHAIVDCCTRELVAWTVDLRGRTEEAIACVDQSRDALDGEKSVWQEISDDLAQLDKAGARLAPQPAGNLDTVRNGIHKLITEYTPANARPGGRVKSNFPSMRHAKPWGEEPPHSVTTCQHCASSGAQEMRPRDPAAQRLRLLQLRASCQARSSASWSSGCAMEMSSWARSLSVFP